MKMENKKSFKKIETRYDDKNEAMWCYMNAEGRPCVSPELLVEFKEFQDTIIRNHGTEAENSHPDVHYIILASKTPGVFNLGGDLELFIKLILNSDRNGLLDYARACIDVLYLNAQNLNLPLTTIALIQGKAFAGGFEAALSCNFIIAEKSAQIGFPDIKFNMFPGMGAYSFVARRLDAARAERMILSGEIYGAEEIYKMGLIDVLTNDGEGEKAVADLIRRHKRSRKGYLAVQKVRNRYSMLKYEELFDITKIWVDTALSLDKRDLRLMEKLIKAQDSM